MPTASPADVAQAVRSPAGYSPRLKMSLQVAGRTFDVAETSRDFVVLRDAADVGPAEAVLHIAIGDDMTSHRIRLPYGIEAGREEQPIAR